MLAFPRAVVVEILTAEAALIADAALLAGLTPKQRRIVLSVLDNYPALPVAKCIAMLSEAGM